jgi:NAD(P)-dependent dehydrogenase (short-subunit alcohol dehydrogenase family)
MPSALADKTEAEWMRVLQVDLIGPFLCSQTAARHMRKLGRGKIVNVTSVRAVDHCGRAPVMDYSAAKAGVLVLRHIVALLSNCR